MTTGSVSHSWAVVALVLDTGPDGRWAADRLSGARLRAWAERLGVDRSELLRDALRRHLLRLASERDAETWQRHPLTAQVESLGAVAHWGPAEDRADWADAAR